MKNYQSGFTILELALVIVLIGILAVNVVPKFFSERGFEDHALKNSTISFLKLIQTRAMQNTVAGCSTVLVQSDVIGIPDGCDVTQGIDTNDPNNVKNFVLIEERSLAMFSSSFSFSFDRLGRPVSCADPCEIDIVGESTLTIVIENEGYIHEK